MFKRNKQAVSLAETTTCSVLPKWLWSVLFAAIIGYLLVWGYTQIVATKFLPITKVRALGDFSYVTEEMLNLALKNNEDSSQNKNVLSVLEDKGFFNIDVDAIKIRVEKMAWVKRASVQRVWPDTLVIEIAEHKPVAYWGNSGLVNDKGEIFYPDAQTYPNGLPYFVAAGDLTTINENNIAVKCLRYYLDASDMFSPIKLTIKKVKFDARQALTLSLDSGLNLNVGRQNKLYRLQRFTQIYSTLRERVSFIKNVDMRYTNGFSVKWKQRQALGAVEIKEKSNGHNV